MRAPSRPGGPSAGGARRRRVGTRQPVGARPAARRRRSRGAHREPTPPRCSACPTPRVLDDAVEALAAKAPAGAFSVVDQVMATGHDPRRFAMDLLERVRDLLVLQTVPDAPDRGLLAEYAPDQIERMRLQAGRMGASELSRAAELLHAGLIEMRDTLSPRLMLELVLARVLLPGRQRRPGRAAGSAGAAGAPARRAAQPRVSRRPPPARSHPLASRASCAPAAPSQLRPPRRAPARSPPRPQPKPKPGRRRRRQRPLAERRPPPAQPPAARLRRSGACRPRRPRAGSGPSLADVVPAWPDLLAAIAASRAPGFRTAGALLAQGQPIAVRDGELVLAFTPGNATTSRSPAPPSPCSARRWPTVSAASGRSASSSSRPRRQIELRPTQPPAASIARRRDRRSSPIRGRLTATASAPAPTIRWRSRWRPSARRSSTSGRPASATCADVRCALWPNSRGMPPGAQPNIQQLMKQAQQMQAQMEAAQAELAEAEVEGTRRRRSGHGDGQRRRRDHERHHRPESRRP